MALGDGWADARNLTISFVPDGTLIGQPPPNAVEVQTVSTTLLGTLGLSTVNSSLSPLTGTLDGLTGALTSGPDSRSNASAAFGGLNGWQREVLRAFQTWAAVANVNLSVRIDDGSPFGSGGQFQGDSRYGDIRIGGTQLHPSALANAMIVSPSNGTWSGDVLFNTAVRWGAGGYDLYTVALHEAGHVFGLVHSDDPSSVMSETYVGPRASLSAADLATVRSYYGVRLPDAFDQFRSNDSQTAAYTVTTPDSFTLDAELTSTSDADWYSFQMPSGGRSLSVRLNTTALSLLTARLTVVDAVGRVVGSVSSSDPTAGDLRINLWAEAGGAYYLKVSSDTGVEFGVGRYQLAVGGLSGVLASVAPPTVDVTAVTTSTTPPAENTMLASGTLTKSANQSQFTYTMSSSGLFNLSAEGTANAYGVDLIVEMFDASGRKVLSFTRSADGTRGGKSAYLAAGKYTVRTTAVIPLLAFGVKVNFAVYGGIESDPMGTYKTSTSTSPYQTSPPPVSPPPTSPPTTTSSSMTSPYSY